MGLRISFSLLLGRKIPPLAFWRRATEEPLVLGAHDPGRRWTEGQGRWARKTPSTSGWKHVLNQNNCQCAWVYTCQCAWVYTCAKHRWRNIAITLKMPGTGIRDSECNRLFSTVDHPGRRMSPRGRHESLTSFLRSFCNRIVGEVEKIIRGPNPAWPRRSSHIGGM